MIRSESDGLDEVSVNETVGGSGFGRTNARLLKGCQLTVSADAASRSRSGRTDGRQALEHRAAQRLTRPAAGQVAPQAADRATHAGAELQQVQAHLLDGGAGEFGAVAHQPAQQRQQVVGPAVELKPASVGAVSRAGEPVGGEVVFELLDNSNFTGWNA
jgi:hypothetical protein